MGLIQKSLFNIVEQPNPKITLDGEITTKSGHLFGKIFEIWGIFYMTQQIRNNCASIRFIVLFYSKTTLLSNYIVSIKFTHDIIA